MKAEFLRTAVLQMAIEGKLLEQDPADVPPDTESTVPEEEQPFSIPESWRWVVLGSIGTSNIDLTYKPADIVDNNLGTPVLRSNNIQDGKLVLNDLKRLKIKIYQTKFWFKLEIF